MMLSSGSSMRTVQPRSTLAVPKIKCRVVSCPDNRVLVMIADVTGHGVGPALVAASFRAYARAILPYVPLGVRLSQLDKALSSDLLDGSFVTFAVAEIRPSCHSIRYCSAGHGPVVKIDPEGNAESLPAQSPPLGLGCFGAQNLEPVEFDLTQGLFFASS